MNELGIALAGLVIQVTLAMLPATALHLLASRRGPVAGSWTAAASLAMIVGLTVLAFLPRPEIGAEPATASTQIWSASRTSPPRCPIPAIARRPPSGRRHPVASSRSRQARAIWRDSDRD